MRPSVTRLRNVKELIDFYAQFNPSALSIKQFTDFGLNACERKSYLFLRNELPVRLANIMKEIALLPEKLLKMPSVVQVNDWYKRSFEEIIDFEKKNPVDQSTLDSFCDTLIKVRNRHSDVVQTMAQGVIELKESHTVDSHIENNIQYFLDRFYMSRISIRMLINQHTLLFNDNHLNGPGDYPTRHVGCIDPQCDIAKVVEDAYANARFVCEQYYLGAPEMNLTEINQKNIRIIYVPSHLYHILFEVFKNSMRAVIEFHSSTEKYTPIDVSIVRGKEDICIKISDRGGGITRSQVDHLFQYMYSTAPHPSKSEVHTVPLAGYGYGLPISRLYARYFHGDLNLLSCDGLGTDTIVHLKMLSNEANELLPVFNKASSKFYRSISATGDWSSSNSRFSNSQNWPKSKNDSNSMRNTH